MHSLYLRKFVIYVKKQLDENKCVLWFKRFIFNFLCV